MDADKPFACDHDGCGKYFKKRCDLTRHRMIHTGEKPYTCDICEKKFSRSETLAKHERIHSGKKPYNCDICEDTFSNCSNLTKHKRIHTGEKPYSCEMCQKSFICSSNLSRHNKTLAHLERKELQNTDLPSAQTSFVDFGKSIKVEDIKEEIKEEENVDDPFSIHQETGNSNVGEDNNEEIKEEESGAIFNDQAEIDRIRLYSCDICKEKFTERIVLMMHMDINHSQQNPQVV